jgi:plastocyanin domain-containing protein
MLAAGIVLAATVSADGGPQKTSVDWSDPVPCYKTVEQVVICDLGSPAASPVATETPIPLPTIVPEPTNVIDTIIALPSTGVGPGR